MPPKVLTETIGLPAFPPPSDSQWEVSRVYSSKYGTWSLQWTPRCEDNDSQGQNQSQGRTCSCGNDDTSLLERISDLPAELRNMIKEQIEDIHLDPLKID